MDSDEESDSTTASEQYDLYLTECRLWRLVSNLPMVIMMAWLAFRPMLSVLIDVLYIVFKML